MILKISIITAILFSIISYFTITSATDIIDPRLNSSYYDLKISGSFPEKIQVIGNISKLLINNSKINKTTTVFNYKLIYYSPQLIPYSSVSREFYSANALTSELFHIDVQIGTVELRVPANEPILEYLCVKKKLCSCFSCIFTLNFIYSTQNKINSDTIRVFIDDSNEHRPTFTSESPIVLNISESSHIGQFFTLTNFSASDSDPFYNQITYRLSDKDDSRSSTKFSSTIFDIKSVNNDVMTIFLKTHLDFETKQKYELFLIAEDNGSPKRLRASRKLIINIIDENDNSPVCGESIFLASLNENVNESNFLQIKASDGDSGLNSKLQYFMVSDLSEISLFSIDQENGWISLKEPLDYEKKSFYDLNIEVRDSGRGKTLKTRCAARVNVLDLNDNPAKIKIIEYLDESQRKDYYSFNTMSSTNNETEFNKIKIYENNKPGTVLALLKVFDSDEVSNYKFSISPVVYGTDNVNIFKIRPRSDREFELIVTGVFDAERSQNYHLKIVLYDLQSTGKQSNKTISQASGNFFQINLIIGVQVLDMNDNGPLFVARTHNFSLQENKLNVKLPLIDLLDQDVGTETSELRFEVNSELISKHISLFYTNNALSLYVIVPFDYEKDPITIEFNIRAIDAKNRTDLCHVTLHLIDQNDNSPQFMNYNSTFYLKENLAPNSFIGQVVAVDEDLSEINSDISFRFIGNEHLNSLLKIYKSGVIFTNKFSFDRETQDHYNLNIEAFNKVDNTSTVANYHIVITDQNDNYPYFINPTTKYLNIEPKKPQSNLQTLFTAQALDKDIGLNGKILYSIGDNMSLLSIDQNNGTVSINENINIVNLSSKRVLNVTLKARDCGQPSLETTVSFVLYLNFQASEMPLSVLRSLNAGKMNTSQNEINELVYITRNWNLLNYISNNYIIIIGLVVLLLLLILLTFYVLYTAFKRTECAHKLFESSKKTCCLINKSERTLQDHNLTVKDASLSESSKSESTITNQITDQKKAVKFTHETKVSSVFDPTYLNDFYSKVLFSPNTNDVYSNSQTSDDSVDILAELYHDSKRLQNYENVNFTGNYNEAAIKQAQSFKSSNPKLNTEINELEALNSYIYSLPNLIDENFANNRLNNHSNGLDFNSDSQQTSYIQADNQILLNNSYKSSSDQMLKDLLEKFEIIYNDSVIQNKNLNPTVSQVNSNDHEII